jgi:O-antigen ligase
MRLARNAAHWTLPLVLAPPMVMIGRFGVTLAEFIVVAAGFAILAFCERPPRGTPTFMIIYLLCFCLGWLGALFSAFRWNIPVGVGDVVFFYTLLLAWFGFLVGRYSDWHLRDIVRSRFASVIIVGVALFAVAYPLMAPGMRHLIMSPFINENFYRRLASPRFPGIGINANVYSFMVYVFLIFTLQAYLKDRGSLLLPLAAIAIIVAAAGRTVTALSLLSILILVGAAARSSVRASLDRMRAAVTRRRALAVGAVILLLTVTAIAYGAQARGAFVLYARFQDMFSNTESSGLKTRTDVWAIGIERIKLAPVLGIPADPTRLDDSNPLYFYTPHNEFLYYWTVFGIMGLFAHVYLVIRMVVANLRLGAELPWLLLYGGMILQMMVDSVFSGPRAFAFFFIVIGLNVRYLNGLKAERRRRSPAQLKPVVA